MTYSSPLAIFAGKLLLRQGKPFALTFTLEGDDVPAPAGYNFRMQVRADFPSAAALLSISSEGASPTATVGGIAGAVEVDVDVPAAVTAAIVGTAQALWVADGELYNVAGDVIDCGTYQIVFHPEATR
jgi:hypothetical protein